jgi:lipopolysaccharide O-acetyltransferase
MVSFIKRYGLSGALRLARDLIVTKAFFSRARLIRYPFYIRGAAFAKIGNGFTAGVGLRIDAFPEPEKICIVIGRDVQVNDYVHIAAVHSLIIGNNVLIGSKVLITDHNHGVYGGQGAHSDPAIPPAMRKLGSAAVQIGDNVWIGENVAVLPGVTIGAGAVIGCNSVVTGNIPDNTLAAGNPARAIRQYNRTTGHWESA